MANPSKLMTGRIFTMTINLDLDAQTAARLKAEARAKDLSPEKVAEQLSSEALIARTFPQGSMTPEEFHQMLRAMAQGSEAPPQLSTESFTRDSFYEADINGGHRLPVR